jgi:hypothetical protein
MATPHLPPKQSNHPIGGKETPIAQPNVVKNYDPKHPLRYDAGQEGAPKITSAPNVGTGK